jgi:hypothetical protein
MGSPLKMYDNEIMNTTMNDSPRQIMVSLEKRPKLSGLNMIWKKLECQRINQDNALLLTRIVNV